MKDARTKASERVANQSSSQKGATPIENQAEHEPTSLPTPGVVKAGVPGTPEAGVKGGGTVGDVGPDDGLVSPEHYEGVRGEPRGNGNRGTIAPAGPVQSATSVAPGLGAGGVGATGHLDNSQRPVGGQPASGASGAVIHLNPGDRRIPGS